MMSQYHDYKTEEKQINRQWEGILIIQNWLKVH